MNRASGARIAAAFLLAAAVGACSVAGASNSPNGSPNPSQSPAASASSGPSASSGFYLRAWQTQALEPHQTFGWLPLVTIAGGQYIGGIVAVPAIYPGPLYVGPSSRSITAKGIETIVSEARKQGLLGDRKEFFAEPGKAGAIVGHITVVLDGKAYDLSGDTTSNLRCRCVPDAGSPGAFAAFWSQLSAIDQWLPAELGQQAPYTPDRLAVLTVAPVEPVAGITPNETAWPLPARFATFGSAFGSDRCALVSGADLAKLLPIVKQSNQLTRFVDSSGAKKSLQVRVLVPGEPGPCLG